MKKKIDFFFFFLIRFLFFLFVFFNFFKFILLTISFHEAANFNRFTFRMKTLSEKINKKRTSCCFYGFEVHLSD